MRNDENKKETDKQPETAEVAGQREMPCYAFINLSNGIEAIIEYGLDLNDIRFLRIQSTACEQKRWEAILNDISPDFFILAALGKHVVVYDYGAKKETSRAVWQGLEWIKHVLYKRWAGKEYIPKGRAKSMGKYFAHEYSKLSRKTKAMLDYYGKFYTSDINIIGVSKATLYDGDINMQRDLLLAA